ncbi:MAG: DUF4184 domain-containing protein [Microbacterium sp.]|nr:MAG: DUF4184 domain-containing protein [Microbacterium sp.]
MPFTPSHAVVALPFVRTPLLPAAIAVGAMTPDLPLFVRGTPVTYQTTHTNLVLSTAIALVLLALWCAVLRPAVRELSPLWLARRLPAEWDRGALVAPEWWSRRGVAVSAAILVLSLLLGVLSHIVWDAFTHEGRWGVALVPALESSWGPLPGYKWMQYASSVGGLAILAICAALWLRRRTPAPAQGRVFPGAVRWVWWLSLPVALVAALAIGYVIYGPFGPTWTFQHLAYRVLPPTCAAWGVVTIALAATIAVIVTRRGRADR